MAGASCRAWKARQVPVQGRASVTPGKGLGFAQRVRRSHRGNSARQCLISNGPWPGAVDQSLKQGQGKGAREAPVAVLQATSSGGLDPVAMDRGTYMVQSVKRGLPTTGESQASHSKPLARSWT